MNNEQQFPGRVRIFKGYKKAQTSQGEMKVPVYNEYDHSSTNRQGTYAIYKLVKGSGLPYKRLSLKTALKNKF